MIRVPTETRDRLRTVSASEGTTFAAVIDRGLDLIDRELFWAEVASIQPDQGYTDEFQEWEIFAGETT